MPQIGDDLRISNVDAEPPEEGADRSTQAAEELAGAPAIFPGLQPLRSLFAKCGEPTLVSAMGL
jgi:hypothetical protein